MKRLPTEKALVSSIDYSTDALAKIKHHSADLLRRRKHDAGRDGYPTQSMGGGASGSPSSSTEVAALSPPMSDPIGRYIDDMLTAVFDTDAAMKRASDCLALVMTVDQELRGRVSSVVECECCESPISGVGDDRRRNGFCPACFKAWIRWRPTVEDPTSKPTFISWRRDKLKASA